MSKLVIIGALVVTLALGGSFIVIDKVKGDENAGGQICPDKGDGGMTGMHEGGMMGMHGDRDTGEGEICDHEGEGQESSHQGAEMDEMIANGQLKQMVDSGQFEQMHGAEKAAEVKRMLESGDTAALKAYMQQIQGSHQQ